MRKHIPLTGSYGNWTILGPTEKRFNKIYYLCQCKCGNQRYIDCYALKSGHSKSCGCTRNLGRGIDLTGKRFGHLVAVNREIIGNRNYWRCKCDCGEYKMTTTGDLNSGFVTTCGCRAWQGEATQQALSKYCVDGTYIPGVTRKHLNKNNSSGVTGVRFDNSRGKWSAYIKFGGKFMFLGRYMTKEQAIEARQIAEKEYFGKYRNPN